MQVSLVVGRNEPKRDGVADYATRLAAHLPAYGVQARIVPAGRRLRAAVRELRRDRPDLVHVQFAPSAYGYRPGIGLLPMVVGRPVITTMHEYGWWSWPAGLPDRGWRAVETRGLWDREAGRLSTGSAALIATTSGHAELVFQRVGRPARVIPIGSNVERVPADRAATRDRFALPARAPVVVFFGFVHPVKGIRWLLRAVAALRADRRPDLRLVVAGGFDSLALPGREALDFQAEVRADIEALGMTDAVTVTGWLPAPEISALLQAADVAALPFTAGLTTKSGSLLAALDHDLPVVGTAGPGTERELAAAALLGPVRESEVLAAHLDHALAGAAPAAGRRLADRHSWQAAAQAHAELYRAALLSTVAVPVRG